MSWPQSRFRPKQAPSPLCDARWHYAAKNSLASSHDGYTIYPLPSPGNIHSLFGLKSCGAHVWMTGLYVEPALPFHYVGDFTIYVHAHAVVWVKDGHYWRFRVE